MLAGHPSCSADRSRHTRSTTGRAPAGVIGWSPETKSTTSRTVSSNEVMPACTSVRA